MIAIATGYPELDKQLSEKIVDSKVVSYKEFFMNNTSNDFDTVITSKHLAGQMPEHDFLFMLKGYNIRVIYVTNDSDIDSILTCFEFAIYDFLFDPITAEKIIDVLNNPRSFSDVSSIYLKYSNKKHNFKPLKEKKIVEVEKVKEVEKIKVVEKRVVETRLVKQNVITFYSPDNNILNATVLANAATAFQKKSDHKLLVIDFDICPCMDHVLDVNKEILYKDSFNLGKIDTGLSACYSTIENHTFSPDLLKKFIITNKKNIDILTGIYNDGLVENMGMNHFKKIIEVAQEIYDVILIAVNPFKFITATGTAIANSNKVIITCESNYTSARAAIASLKTFKEAGMVNDKFGIVIADLFQDSLEIGILDRIFEDYKIIAEIPFNKKYNKLLNDKSLLINLLHVEKDNRTAYSKMVSFMGLSHSQTVINSDSSEDLNCSDEALSENNTNFKKTAISSNLVKILPHKFSDLKSKLKKSIKNSKEE